MKTHPIYPKIPLAQTIIALCYQKEIKHIVISPGSRNAPLTIGFTNHPYFTCYSIVDERCAAFFAMGIAQQLQQPVAVVCTSGSAVLNYYPAVAEAFYSQIPLIILSADRPIDKIDIGDGQTIRQQNVFSNHSLCNVNLTENHSTENEYQIQHAFHVAKTKLGPIHINIPFEEPLYETTTTLNHTPQVFSFNNTVPSFSISSQIINIWNSSKKKLILIGTNYPNTLTQEYLNILAQDPSVLVMTEATSNVHHDLFISNIDTLITPFTPENFEALQPEILITLGGMIVSKRIKSFLRQYKPQHHWHIDPLRAYDTYGCLSKHFETTPNTFFKLLFTKYTPTPLATYQPYFLKIKALRKQKQHIFLQSAPYSDLKVFEYILKVLPHNIQLQISNSSPIRYAQLFSVDKSIEVYCNRGTSGIDGSTSTAIGASLINKKPTIFITGDISFFYDSNALWNKYIPNHFKIILINNSGGGIFRILPGHQETKTFNTYFETSHQLNAKHLANMYQLKYITAYNILDIENQWETFLNETQPLIFEIFTPEKTNNTVLLDYFKNLT